MKFMCLTITGEADKVEPAIVCAMNAVREKFPEQEMHLSVHDTDYSGKTVVLKNSGKDSWL